MPPPNDLRLFITSPAAGAVAARTTVVSGRAYLRVPDVYLEEVRVTYGGGTEKTVPLTATTWHCEVEAPSSAQPGATLTIVVTAYGRLTDGDLVALGERTRDVVLDATVPDLLTIDSFASPVTTRPGVPHVLDLSGTAGDTTSGIAKVEVRLDDAPSAAVDELVEHLDVPTGRSIWLWKKRAVQVFADLQGAHRFTVRATDGTGNTIESTADIVVRLPFEAGPTEQVFGPTRHLVDLLDFARRYVEIGGATGTLTPAILAARFHQPFDRLVDPTLFEQASAPVPQARIAVEVLAHLPDPAVVEPVNRHFRGVAYRAFLRGLGTSYDELRLTRGPQARAALAERLGIGPVAVGAARIDELTIPPEEVTDDQLAALFGYAPPTSTSSWDAAVGSAKLFLWRRDALRAQWQADDAAGRDGTASPRPILDPDVVPEEYLRAGVPGDPAYALWIGRRQWMEERLAEITATQATAAATTRFDALVATFVGDLDPSLSALGEQDADGVDVRPDLPQGLDLDAFRFLVRGRALLMEGVELDTEWHDIAAILLQVQKRRRFQPWRTEENQASLVLEPASFTLDVPEPAAPAEVSRWRARPSELLSWQRTLAARAVAAAALEPEHRRLVEATEASVLPQLRDALVGLLATDESAQEAAERLTREFLIDLSADAGQRTTRVGQALETLRAVLFSTRSGRLPRDSGPAWTIDQRSTADRQFDREWAWMGSFRGWLSAMRVFAYPENQLLPALYEADAGGRPPTSAYRSFLEALRAQTRLTPDLARQFAADYITRLKALDVLRPDFPGLTDQVSDADLVDDSDPARPSLRTRSSRMFVPGIPHREIFWLVPMALAAKLSEAGHFQAALDWYRTVFAFHLPAAVRKIDYGLVAEENLTSSYGRVTEWLIRELNPHVFAAQRRNCSSRATVLAIAGCFTAFADAQFDSNSADGDARARTLYETAVDLLDLPEARPETGSAVPFPINPVWVSLRDHARSGLAKIHRGLNIAGVATPDSGYESALPSQYRYGVLVDRAKNLVGIAQQVEGAFLSALEQRDAKTYDELRAGHDLQVAGATVVLHDTKVGAAEIGIRQAGLQRERAELQERHFTRLIDDGLNAFEQSAVSNLKDALLLQKGAAAVFGASAVVQGVKAGLTFGLFGDPAGSAGQALATLAGAATTASQIEQMRGSFERREQEWKLQRGLAHKDVEIGRQQVALAQNQRLLAEQERGLARLQQLHAEAVATFLATRFTNAELFEWMSGVLGRVYAFFLQQATALARLAEAQLAFERQELPAGFIGADYWRDGTADATAPDRRGLTGSARLLQDVHRLDQYAFDTDRRKLHLSQTFSLSQIAAFELQQFRDTGLLTFATTQTLFDREFPGHYLRLVKRVKISLVALLPPVRGVRATLTASGVSRTVVTRGPFETVTLRREPASIAFTSPTGATGLFDLEPDGGLLLPFEGMGVDTVWQLQLPKAANPIDYRMIADVLLTIEYTALDSGQYREQVVRSLDRRFSGDRTFSIRNQFPDTWYELNNPESLPPALRLRAVLPLTSDDFPPHLEDMRVDEVSVFAVRADGFLEELTIVSLSHTAAGQSVTTAELTTTGGIASTRRPTGAPWRVLRGREPAGTWEIRLTDTELVRTWFRDGRIDDVVLVLTLAGTTPEWP